MKRSYLEGHQSADRLKTGPKLNRSSYEPEEWHCGFGLIVLTEVIQIRYSTEANHREESHRNCHCRKAPREESAGPSFHQALPMLPAADPHQTHRDRFCRQAAAMFHVNLMDN